MKTISILQITLLITIALLLFGDFSKIKKHILNLLKEHRKKGS